jgi:hypothetical protein
MALSVQLLGPEPDPESRVVESRLLGSFPDLPIVPDDAAPEADALVEIQAPRWRERGFDPVPLDQEIAAALAAAGRVALRIVDRAAPAPVRAETACEVVTRYQRLLPGDDRHAPGSLFCRAKVAHGALHDLRKPLVAADHDHAVDTWRWVLRLCPEASLALQLAALFHDVERLHSESERRIEQHAADYQAFKAAHAAAGARLAAAAVLAAGADPALAERVAALVAEHERPSADPERLALNEADALSFFSLNACGFIAYYGVEHTRKKVAYSLARLGPRGRRTLGRVRLRADIAALVDEELAGPRPPDGWAGEGAHP